MTIRIREFAEQDLPIVAELLNEYYRNEYEFYPYDENRLRPWLQGGKLKILMAEENGKILGSGAYHDGHWGEEIEWIAVHERPDRKALENMFVTELEKFVKTGKVFTSVDDGSPKINDWTERGYKMEGGLYHMVAVLDGSRPLPPVPDCAVVRSLKPTEERQFVELVNGGFGAERVSLGDIQVWKTDSPPFNEEWIHVAEASQSLVSVVVAKPDTRYNKFLKGKRGYLGPATTLPDYRNKNLASALTVRAMNFLFEKGMNAVALYTSETNTASTTLLRKIGFQVGHHWKFMRKTLAEK